MFWTRVEFDAIGFDDADVALGEISDRAGDSFHRSMFEPLEEAEGRHLVQLLPKYFDSGRLFRSLTEDGGDAIREIHGLNARFGTDVPYARAAASRGGDLILVIDKLGQRQFAQAVADYIVGMHG